jgi:hypothetical protein
MIARYNNISLALGAPGIILQIAGYVMAQNPQQQQVGFLVQLGGTVLLIAGLAMYAKAKGRSPAWGLMGFLSLIGLIVLACLKDETVNPRREYETPPPVTPFGAPPPIPRPGGPPPLPDDRK